jgi:hypothetical protein
MKTINFIFISLFSLLFVCSCTKHDFDYIPSQAKEHQYAKAFEQTFGNIASSQTWGFSQPKAYTRSAMPNSNEWGTNNGAGYLNFPTPAAITAEEREAVLAVFNQKGKETYESIIDVDSFFVQQVYCGPNGNKMNELATTVDYKRERNVICWWPYQDELIETLCEPYDDIINNFNNGKYSGNAEQGCMLMYNSSTKLDFSFKTSQSGGQRIYKHWRMEKINGNYYVGFDHEAWRQAPANANEEDKRDYIYNDWIIKIVPGLGYSKEDKIKEAGRIICEDLGGIGDFDFNDVVFDATIYESGKTIITLQAAGGTLPLTVAGIEVHEAFGVSTKDMVNTGVGIVKDAYTFEASEKYNSLIEIPVIVMHNANATNMERYTIELKAEIGKAPQKICVPTSFEWPKEYKSIEDAYPGFKNWVNTGDKWYNENPNYALIYKH